MQSQKGYQKCFSFELFPPKTEQGKQKLYNTCKALSVLNPAFYSVTFGAGGSTREGTFETVSSIMQQYNTIEAAPHISCIGTTKKSIQEMLDAYKNLSVKRIVVLRGDMPSGMQEAGEFRHAYELVEFIRSKTGDYFHIEVAAYPEFHPQSVSAQADLLYFKKKVEAGANSAITQYFFNLDAYIQFVDSCEKLNITIPIVPGIMPITNYIQLARFSDTCGAEIPQWIRKRLQGFDQDMASLRSFGIDVVSNLCRQLIEYGAPGLHIYTMNQSDATLSIFKNL